VRPSQIFATLANFQKTCPRNPLELPEKNGTSKNAPFCGSFLEVSCAIRVPSVCHFHAIRLPECWKYGSRREEQPTDVVEDGEL
jgi:hypothetical protein